MVNGSERILKTLRDVAGVEGSWLLEAGGTIVGRDFSALYPDELLAQQGSRLRQIAEAAAEHIPGRDEDLCLRFEGRALFIRRAGPLLLAVVALPTVNYQSLRIGANMVLRQLSVPPAQGTPSPASPPPSASTPPPAAPRAIAAPRPAVPPPARPAQATPPPKKSSGIWGD